MLNRNHFLLIIYIALLAACSSNEEPNIVVEEVTKYQSQNVIIIVMDGARFTETWGDNSHQNIPHLSQIFSQTGIVNTSFFNNGLTKTTSGHSAITTGRYEALENTGNEYPSNPSFMQFWNEKNRNNTSWIIASKDKLGVLRNCKNLLYNERYLPHSDCGVAGIGSGYRHDSVTLKIVLKTLNDKNPNLTIINFREPDFSGHQNDWNAYINGIQLVDKYISQIDSLINKNEFFANKTTLFVTNDHGRHLDSIQEGFANHGDDCLGCRHINFFAKGPDFRSNEIISIKRELPDINATVLEILNIDNQGFQTGNVMWELFNE